MRIRDYVISILLFGWLVIITVLMILDEPVVIEKPVVERYIYIGDDCMLKQLEYEGADISE